jgi:photosystem II stability/assembly factor-like uncharacterized protein
MRNTFILGVLSLIFIGCSTQAHEERALPPQKSPHDFMFMQRAYPTGEIRIDAYAKAIAWKKQTRTKSVDGIWEFVGPENIGGRISDIEIPIDQAETYYIGAASGGIFKTTDAGDTWNPIFDSQEMLSIGDIEISKSNTDVLWVGTGEVNAGGGSLVYNGDGIYTSTDAGLTWESKGLANVGSIGKVLIDPNDENTLFVGAMGPLFSDDSNRGVYRSTDGGETWEQVLFVSDITGVIDMANHPSNSEIIYAATWERVRRPEYRDYGGETSGLYRSLDGGDTWSELSNGLPSIASQKGRISISISQSNPEVLYSRYADASGAIQGVYRTADGGDNWTTVNSSQLNNVGFHWWFRGIYVDPTDENTIYNVDYEVQKSVNGGMSWTTAFPGVHVDQHALAFNTMADGEVLLGNDGGLYKSTNDGASSVKDVTLPITQFYRFHVDPQNEDKIYGGSQDNSTIRTTTAGLSNWSIINGGDGFQPLVDASNTNTIYALSQNGNLRKSVNNAGSFSNATNGIPSGDRNNWDTPIAMDPQNSQVLYYGTQRVFKSSNAAGNWSAISSDLSNGSGGGNLSFGTITSIDVSPLDSDVITAGTDDGNIWITLDGGENWDNVSATLPDLWCTKVLADRSDANSFYVTFSGYRYGESLGHVFKSNNAGETWTDIGSSIPDIPVNDIVKDLNGKLYVATDIGVLVSDDDGTSWEPLGENMPSVVVTDMHIHEANQFLYAATYGRSAYKIDISDNLSSLSADEFSEGISMYPNPVSKWGDINISLEGMLGPAQVELFDGMGRLIFEKPISGTENNVISLTQLQAGVYFVKITQGENTALEKLLVQ